MAQAVEGKRVIGHHRRATRGKAEPTRTKRSRPRQRDRGGRARRAPPFSGDVQVSDPAVYIRLDDATLQRVERHVAELQDATEATVTKSDALRDLVRRGLDEADVERGRRARRRR